MIIVDEKEQTQGGVQLQVGCGEGKASMKPKVSIHLAKDISENVVNKMLPRLTSREEINHRLNRANTTSALH